MSDQPSEDGENKSGFAQQFFMMLAASGPGSFASSLIGSSLGAQLFQSGPGGGRLERTPDGRYNYRPQTTQVAVNSEAYQAYQTVVKISKEVDLPPDFLLRQEWYASRDLPSATSEGFRQTIVDGVDYLKANKPDVLKNHPELVQLQEQARNALEKYKDPKDYLAALADTNNHDLDQFRELLNKPETSAYVSAGYAHLQMDKGYTPEQAGAQLYLIRRLGETRAREILDRDNVEDVSAFLPDDLIKADPSLSDLKGMSAHDIAQLARNKMDISVAPAVQSVQLDAKSLSTIGGRQRIAMDFYVDKYMHEEGYSFDQAAIFAAGHVANLTRESGLDDKQWGDGDTAYGIKQWHADRRVDFAKQYGYEMNKPPPGLSQEDILKHQLEYSYWDTHANPDPHQVQAAKELRAATNANQAGYALCFYDERPADKESKANSRGQLAQQILADYKASIAAHPTPMASNEPPPSNGPVTYVNGYNPQAALRDAETNARPDYKLGACKTSVQRMLNAAGVPIPNGYDDSWFPDHGYHRVTDGTIKPDDVIHFKPHMEADIHGHWELVLADGRIASEPIQWATSEHAAVYPNAHYKEWIENAGNQLNDRLVIWRPDAVPAPSNIPVAANTFPQVPPPASASPNRSIGVTDMKRLSFGLGPAGMRSPVQAAAFHPSDSAPVHKPGDSFTVNVVGDLLAAQVSPALGTAFRNAGYTNVHIINRGIPSSGLTRGGNASLGMEAAIDSAIANGGDIVAVMAHNDSGQAHSAIYRQDLERVFKKLQDAQRNGRNVTIISPLYSEEGTHNLAKGLHDNLVQIEKLYREVAVKYDLKYVEANTIGYSRAENTHGVHLNEAGYQRLAEQMMVPGIVNRPAAAPAPAPALPPVKSAAAPPATLPAQIAAAAQPPAAPNRPTHPSMNYLVMAEQAAAEALKKAFETMRADAENAEKIYLAADLADATSTGGATGHTSGKSSTQTVMAALSNNKEKTEAANSDNRLNRAALKKENSQKTGDTKIAAKAGATIPGNVA